MVYTVCSMGTNKVLLLSNLFHLESEPQLLFDGRVVLNASSKCQRRCIDDIVTWLKAFSVFSLILASHFPHRWRDFTLHLLLIRALITSSEVVFGWPTISLSASMPLARTDWSNMDVQLFNFHSAGATVRSRLSGSSPECSEPWNSKSCRVLCLTPRLSLCP